MAGDNEKLNDSCPACGSKIDSDELCTCGYDPSLELQEGTYVPQFALTATLDKVPGDAGYQEMQDLFLKSHWGKFGLLTQTMFNFSLNKLRKNSNLKENFMAL